jgi:hydrogenase maturation protein HypF
VAIKRPLAKRSVESMEKQGCIRCRITVTGIVQGVGFRPYVHGLAGRYGLTGWVENTDDGVRIEVQGPGGAVLAFRL